MQTYVYKIIHSSTRKVREHRQQCRKPTFQISM